MSCDSPYMLKNPKAHIPGQDPEIPVPCGKCPPCRKRRVDQWVFRLLQEDLDSHSAYFITLTYDTQFVPISPNGFMTLEKSDFQDFMKRLRKLNSSKIKYYMCGEYGTQNWRPHYHAIIFNVEDEDMIEQAWTLHGELIGSTHVGNVTRSSIAYCAKYIDKGKRIPAFTKDDRAEEYSAMSKGLGAGFLTQAAIDYWSSNLDQNYIKLPDGTKLPMPRYYRDKILSEDQKYQQSKIIKKEVYRMEAYMERQYYIKHPNGDYQRFRETQKYARWKKAQRENYKRRKL